MPKPPKPSFYHIFYYSATPTIFQMLSFIISVTTHHQNALISATLNLFSSWRQGSVSSIHKSDFSNIKSYINVKQQIYIDKRL